MMRSSIKILIICILINANLLAKNNEYYYMDGEECSIAIPINFHITKSFTKQHITFLWEKGLETKVIIFSSIEKNKFLDYMQKEIQEKNLILLKKEKRGNLLYQKYKMHIEGDLFEYRYLITGRNFYYAGEGINEKDAEYMIDHCLRGH